MIVFLDSVHAYGSGTAPGEYMEKLVLPRNGYPLSEQRQMSLIDLHEVRRLLGWEAQYTKRS